MFRLTGKQSGRTVAVADIGSSSVAVGIVRVVPHGGARVLVAERATLPVSERSLEATATGVISLLEETATKVLATYAGAAERPKHVEAAYAVIHSPWTRSKTIRATLQLPEELRIERGMISNLAQEALQADAEYQHDKVLEAGVIRVELNGYPTLKPVGKRAHHVAASALLSECDPRIRAGVAEVLAKVFACPPPTLRSDTRALLSVTRESSTLPKEALIVNMTYEATNIVVVRKGIIAETALVAEGIGSILRRIAGEKMPEETLALIRLLALDQCDSDACEATKAAIARAEPELARIFGETFGHLSASRRLPNRLVLVAHEDLAGWLSRFFDRIDFAPFTVTTRPFLPVPLSLESIKELAVFENASGDVSLGIAAALVNMEEYV
ncbi:hypothetical protein HYW60_00470 [Candidatus Kaiserbacteria bacterium]|nr:hypothetical protein [Candidatus Kaiserbacteria bacterium]